MSAHHLCGAERAEGIASGESLEEGDAHRVHVGPRVDAAAEDLLGGEETRRADDVAAGRAVARRVVAEILATPKSRTIVASAVRNTFAGLMSRWVIPAACAASSPDRISIVMRTASPGAQRASRAEPVAERLALEERHDEVRAPALDVPCVDDGARFGCATLASARASRK